MYSEYDPNAQWNQEIPVPVNVGICVTTTLTKKTTVSTDIYSIDPYGDCDFSDRDLLSAYKEDEFTITELLDILKDYVKRDMEGVSPYSGLGRHLNRVLTACEGWEVGGEEVEKD